MKEEIIRYKGTNPLIGIPASIGIAALIIFIATCVVSLWPDEGGLRGFFGGLFILIEAFGLTMGMISFIDFLSQKDIEPCTVYASKKGIRATVAIACLTCLAFLLYVLILSNKPSFATTLSSLCYAMSLLGVIHLLAQLFIITTTDVTAKAKLDRTKQPVAFTISPIVGVISCICLGLYQHKRDVFSQDRGESLFFMFTVSAISLLWFENKKAGIADREIIPLCTASILWIISALVANYAYSSLASVTFVMPYLVYFVPIILLGFYYYITAPDEN